MIVLDFFHQDFKNSTISHSQLLPEMHEELLRGVFRRLSNIYDRAF